MNFEAKVNVDRLEDKGLFLANVHVRCAECGTRFRWQGLKMGLDLYGTMVSVDHFELRGAIVPDGHMTSLMADIRGFGVHEPEGPR